MDAHRQTQRSMHPMRSVSVTASYHNVLAQRLCLNNQQSCSRAGYTTPVPPVHNRAQVKVGSGSTRLACLWLKGQNSLSPGGGHFCDASIVRHPSSQGSIAFVFSSLFLISRPSIGVSDCLPQTEKAENIGYDNLNSHSSTPISAEEHSWNRQS